MGEIPSKSLMDVLRPSYTLSRIIGIRTFNSRSRIKAKGGLIIPIVFSLYYIFEWYQAKAKHRRLKYQGYIFQMVECLYYAAFVLRFLTVLSSFLVGLLRSKLWEYSAKSLIEVDKTLEALGSKGQYRKMYIRSLIALTIFFIYTVIFIGSILRTILFRTDNNPSNIWSLVMLISFYFYGELIEYTVTMDFLTLVRCIRSEIQRVNDLLKDVNVLPLSSIAMELMKHREMNDNSFRKIFIVAPASEGTHSRFLGKRNEIFRIRRLLRTVRQIHLELCKISNNASVLYGLQMSLGMAMNIFYCTVYFYTLYSLRRHLMNGDLLLNEFFSMHIFCLFVCTKIFLVNFTCDKATEDAKKTSEIVYTFYAENADYEIRQEIRMFSMQMTHCNSAYTAFGLYVFNCKHICSCLGVITTYLVIMIQMTQ